MESAATSLQPVELKSNQRIVELDGLRGVAILLVISFHYINNQLVNTQGRTANILSRITSFGWVGVDLFFVLSGFLISNILLRNKHSKNYFSTFYIRRLVRIVPNYFLLLLVFFILVSIPWFKSNYFLTGDRVIPAWSYFTMFHNFYMARLHNLGTPALSVTWSIGIEEQFYLVFPLIVYFVKDKVLPWILLAAIVLACISRALYQNWVPPYVLLHCRMDAISFGGLIAWINYHYSIKKLANKYFWQMIALLVGDAALCGFLYIKYNDLGAIKNSLFALVFSIMLVCALAFSKSWYGKLLRNRMLVWTGTISYSLYLFHYLILGVFHHFHGYLDGIGMYNLQDIAISLAALIVSLGFAWLVFKKLETPMVRIGKHFKY